MAGFRVIKRKDTGTLQIAGTDPVTEKRVRQAARAGSHKLAQEEAAALYTARLRESWHGPRLGAHTFAEAALSYCQARQLRPSEIQRVLRLHDAIGGETLLRSIDQDTIARAREHSIQHARKRNPHREPQFSAATLQREIIAPLRAVLTHAARRGWCGVPLFETQSTPQGRTLFLMPDEAERLIAAGAEHLRPLLLFLLGTGARLSEALELEWRDVDLVGARAIFWRTKNGKRRVVDLPPRITRTLSLLQGAHEGRAFLTNRGQPYADANRQYGDQIGTGFRAARRRAGLDPKLTPHCCRHAWASWHYALHKGLLRLKEDGGWSSVALVERYAHLMKEGHQDEIKSFWGLEPPRLELAYFGLDRQTSGARGSDRDTRFRLAGTSAHFEYSNGLVLPSPAFVYFDHKNTTVDSSGAEHKCL